MVQWGWTTGWIPSWTEKVEWAQSIHFLSAFWRGCSLTNDSPCFVLPWWEISKQKKCSLPQSAFVRVFDHSGGKKCGSPQWVEKTRVASSVVWTTQGNPSALGDICEELAGSMLSTNLLNSTPHKCPDMVEHTQSPQERSARVIWQENRSCRSNEEVEIDCTADETIYLLSP